MPYADHHDDLSLDPWGPWSCHHTGISRLLGGPTVAQLEFTPAVGRMRGATLVGDVNGESGVHLMEATDDLAYLRYRYQLQWRDQEYVDLHALRVDDDSHLLRAEFVNNTEVDHRYVMVCYAGLRADSALIPQQTWVGAESYQHLTLPEGVWLRAGRDGLRRLQTAHLDLVHRRGLGRYGAESGMQAHGGPIPEGTHLHWELPTMSGSGCWYLRALSRSDAPVQLTINNEPLHLCADQEWYPCGVAMKVDVTVDHDPGGRWALDGFMWVPAGSEPRDLLVYHAAPTQWEWQRDQKTLPMGVMGHHPSHPQCPMAMCSASERPLAPSPYDQLPGYDLGAPGVVHMHHNNLGDMNVRRRIVGDCLVPWGDHNNTFTVDGSRHHLGYVIGPVRVPAGERRVVSLALAAGPGLDDDAAAMACSRRVLAAAEDIWAAAQAHRQAQSARWQGSGDEQGVQRMLAAYTAANVIFPMPKGLQMTRGYTPGKRWKSPFTWDQGMHAIGMSAMDPHRAWEIIDGCCQVPSSGEAPVVLHGSPMPLAIYAADMTWRAQRDDMALAKRLPALVAVWRWFAGVHADSPYDPSGRGLLSTYPDFYNGAGMDDHPLQHWIDHHLKRQDIANASATSHALRTAKLIVQMAQHLGETDVVAECRAFIERASAALMTAWDADSGWFAWTDLANGEWLQTPFGNGGAANMSLDGVAPLVTGCLPTPVEERLTQHLYDEAGLWTAQGLTAVAAASQSHREDGYWNGNVWIPHQWFMFMACLSNGRSADALRIGEKMLQVWAQATAETDYVYELVDAVSGQGEGHHAFAGLTSPLLPVAQGLRTQGYVTTGWQTRVLASYQEAAQLRVQVDVMEAGKQGMLVVWDTSAKYTLSGLPPGAEVQRHAQGIWEITADWPVGEQRFQINTKSAAAPH